MGDHRVCLINGLLQQSALRNGILLYCPGEPSEAFVPGLIDGRLPQWRSGGVAQASEDAGRAIELTPSGMTRSGVIRDQRVRHCCGDVVLEVTTAVPRARHESGIPGG